MKNKKIIIALDYHPTAQKIAEEGWQLANALGANVILVHIISDRNLYTSMNYDPIMGFDGYLDSALLETQQHVISNLEKESYQFLFKTKEHLGDVTIESIVQEGSIADSLLEIAKQKNASFIVMGSHSQKWLEHLFIGSQTEKVLRHTHLPLYIIPTKN